MKEPIALICGSVLETRASEIQPGSTQDRCEKCNALVWVAPSSNAALKQYGGVIWCANCGIGEITKRPKEFSIMNFTPMQRAELKEKSICPKCLYPYKHGGFALLKICLNCKGKD